MNTRRRRRPTFVPPPVARPAARRLQCVCGKGIDVLPEHAGWKSACPGCGRPFEILVSKDPASGAEIVSLAYAEEKKRNKAAASTAAETSTGLESASDGALTAIGKAVEPEPPDEAQFRCSCGALLAITKERYDKRVKCPACGNRILVTLAYDASSGSFTLHTFSLADARSGGTRLAIRIG